MAESLTVRWPELSIGLVHGKLKPEARDRVMLDFRSGQVQVLVATTVVEVGIDVPNATIMLIENPERFGLAQLHQLRGRVGRGAEESHCILLAERESPRLTAFAATSDGFKIAELDLAERSQGDLLGQRQSGMADIRVARFPQDTDLLTVSRDMARAILEADPGLERSSHAQLKQRALLRYPKAEALFRVG
jgi:ATP-dependent DNA helicase RecG